MNRTVSNIQKNNNLRLKTHSDTLTIYQQNDKTTHDNYLSFTFHVLVFALFYVFITLYFYEAQ